MLFLRLKHRRTIQSELSMRQDKIDDKKSIVNTLRKYCKYIKLKKGARSDMLRAPFNVKD